MAVNDDDALRVELGVFVAVTDVVCDEVAVLLDDALDVLDALPDPDEVLDTDDVGVADTDGESDDVGSMVEVMEALAAELMEAVTWDVKDAVLVVESVGLGVLSDVSETVAVADEDAVSDGVGELATHEAVDTSASPLPTAQLCAADAPEGHV